MRWKALFAFLLFHSLLWLPVRSVRVCCRAQRRVLFELHRADVIQGRVQSCLVISVQPVKGFLFALATCFKMLTMQPFYLE